MSRIKGKGGERELAALLSSITGMEVRRRVRNLKGEDDLEGLPGWSVECKRYKTITPALVAEWWQQAQRQAAAIGCEPVLLYRADFGQWRAVWPAHLVQHHRAQYALATDATIESAPAVWWALCGSYEIGSAPPPIGTLAVNCQKGNSSHSS
jgi:Holliday junction resolvase